MIAAACGGAGAALAPVPGAPQAGGEQSGGGQPLSGNGDGDGTDRGVLYAAGQPNLLIIKNGSLVLQVTGIDAALTSATQQISALNGYVSGSERSGDGEFDQATLTFRIPAQSWDDALVRLRALGTKILDERSTTQDVTSQVVDLGARLKNLQATELALQGTMAKAVEIKDILAVQAELTTVRGQIEQIAAQKTSLEQQAAYSTLAVTFSLKPNPVLTSTTQFDPNSEVEQASASLVSFLQSLATAGIWFAIVWVPILIVLAIIVGIGAFVYRRYRRSDPVGAAPVAPTGDSAS
ncbi:MAG TPA: DUF4349 domain-containing protein [Candidatus Limnocylindrales bacterium]|jgi:hypothetical protein